MSTAPPTRAPQDSPPVAATAPRRLMPVLLTGVFMAALDTAGTVSALVGPDPAGATLFLVTC